MKISIIVPTYNEEKVIGDCLESLLKQTFKDFEVIVVDDGSKDKTMNIVKNFQSKPFKVKLFQQKHQGPGLARNLGAKKARGEILVFVDSDMTFDSKFLSQLTYSIRKAKQKGTFSKEEYMVNNDHAWAESWGINQGWETGRMHSKDYPNRQKVFRAILKSEFDKVGGFSDIGYTDDWTLADKLGYQALAAKGAVFYHRSPENLMEVFRQAVWIGKRKYKFGNIGKIFAICRASLPISIIVGIYKAIMSKKPFFIIFKVVYDSGIFIGALSSFFKSNNAK